MIWDNCNVKLGADAVIDIRSGSTLYITNNSHLSACNNMWDKIIIEPGAYLHVDGNSLIEDGKTAIYSIKGGNYLLNGALLNRNYQHMVLTAFSGTHPGIIKNSNFTCQTITPGTPPTLNPPYPSGTRTYVGINITNVNNTGNATGVTIGVSGNANTFRNMDLGILSVGSSVSVYNNNFINVNNGVASNVGAAIVAEGNATSPSYVPCNLIVGDGTTANKNTFTNCVNGIATIQNMDSKIWLNEFYNINSQGIQVMLNRQNNNALIRGNLFSNMNTGGPSGGSIAIHCQYNLPSVTEIFYNQISNVFKGTGVLLEELNNMSYGAGYSVYDNQIQQVLRGVRALNVNKSLIMNNYIQTESWGGFLPPPSIGVELLGCYGMLVSSNNIQISPANITNTLNGGISASLSPSSFISCNTLLNMGYGIKCAGQMASQIYNNTMNKDFYGFWLDNHGYVGEQNMSSGTGVVYPSYNKWVNIPWPATSATSKRTYISNNTFGNNSPIYYRNPGPTSYQPFPSGIASGPGSLFNLIPTSNGSIVSPACPIAAFSRHSPVLAHLLQSAQDIAMDNFSFPGNDANGKWLNKQGLLVNIKTENIDVSSDGILQGFVNQSATDNLGKLTTLNNIILDPSKHDTTDMIAAQVLNASISANNDIETNQKFLNDIVINNYLSNITNYTTSQLNDLRVLASKCPFTDGLAVYQARVMLSGIDSLGTEYYNACETDGDETRMSYTNTDASQDGNAALLVYPNPATNQLTVNYQIESTDEAVFEVYNSIGEKVMLQKLSAGENEQTFSVVQLNSGVYFYKYSINDQIIKTNKLVIVK